MAEKKTDLTDDDLEIFHDTLEQLLQYYAEYDPNAISTIFSLETVRESIPLDISELLEDE